KDRPVYEKMRNAHLRETPCRRSCARRHVQNRAAPPLQTSARAFAIRRELEAILRFIASLSGTRFIAAFWRRWSRSVQLARIDFDAGPRVHETIDNDTVIRRQTIFDDPQAVIELTECHIFLSHDIAVVDDKNVFSRLLGSDGLIRDKQRRIGRRSGHSDTAKHARGERAVRILEDRAAANRA